MSRQKRALQFAALLALGLGGACGPQLPPELGSVEQAVRDERWWQNPLFPGSTPYNYADGHTWYDSDIGGGEYPTGQYVRLPVDANYIGDWSVGPTYCTSGGTQYWWAPVFQTTVNGKTTNWVFNHLSQSFLGANGRTKGWYNGGALVGLTGGGTCNTGYPTFSSGAHFCNEMRDYDPYTYWQPVGNYTSSCGGSNGTSGVTNPVCGGVSTDPCRGATFGSGLYCGGGLPGGNANTLYNCQGSVTASSTNCACGCQMNSNGVNDACKTGCSDPCSSAKYGNGGYCGGGLTGGDPNALYGCQGGVTASKTVCKCGCTIMMMGVNDVCAANCTTATDMATVPAPGDMAIRAGDLGAPPIGDLGASPSGDLATSAPAADMAPSPVGGGPDLATKPGLVSGGCNAAPGESALWALLLPLLLFLRRRQSQT